METTAVTATAITTSTGIAYKEPAMKSYLRIVLIFVLIFAAGCARA